MSRTGLQITELQKKRKKRGNGEGMRAKRETATITGCVWVSNEGWHECVCKRGWQGSELCVIVLRAFFTSTSGAERGGRERKKYKWNKRVWNNYRHHSDGQLYLPLKGLCVSKAHKHTFSLTHTHSHRNAHRSLSL